MRKIKVPPNRIQGSVFTDGRFSMLRCTNTISCTVKISLDFVIEIIAKIYISVDFTIITMRICICKLKCQKWPSDLYQSITVFGLYGNGISSFITWLSTQPKSDQLPGNTVIIRPSDFSQILDMICIDFKSVPFVLTVGE